MRILIDKGLVKDAPKGGRPKNSEKSSELPSYAEHAAGTLGVTDRTIRTDLHRAKHITPAVLAEVTGTPLDKGVVHEGQGRPKKGDNLSSYSDEAA